MKAIHTFGFFFLMLCFTGCDNNQSLQEYFVDNQENKNFLAVDIPASLLANAESLSPEQRKTLESVKKVNLLAVPKKAANTETINLEREKITTILQDEKYQLLMRFGSGDTRMEMYFTGKEEAIDEVILYGFNEDRGLGIARILGNNMDAGEILGLVQSLQKGDVNIEGLKNITSVFAGVEETEQMEEKEEAKVVE